MKNLLSIVIPTKNRQKYCIKAICQILSLNLKGIEIVVQDNSDEDILRKELEKIDSSNIKYNYHGGILSFVDNFSEAVSLAKGEYVCMIGDDDGILPNIIEVTNFAKEQGYDAVIPGLNAVYCWPSEYSFVKGGENGYLCISYFRNNQRVVDCKKGLSSLMNQAGQGYQQLNIPRLYHGVVKKKCIDAVKEKTGTYFNGLTPDIYMSVALCFTCSQICRIGYPVTISGICSKSGSADSATGHHSGELKNAPHFIGHDTYKWDAKVPAIYSVESIWGETVLHALKDFSASEYYDSFRVDVLDGICLKKYPQFTKEIKRHASLFKIPIILMKFSTEVRIIRRFVNKCIKRLKRKKRDVIKYYDVQGISEAAEIIIEELRKRGIYT